MALFLLSLGLFFVLWIIKLALVVALFVAHTKEVSAVCYFFFQLLKIQLYFVHIFCCFRPRARKPSSRDKFS